MISLLFNVCKYVMYNETLYSVRSKGFSVIPTREKLQIHVEIQNRNCLEIINFRKHYEHSFWLLMKDVGKH